MRRRGWTLSTLTLAMLSAGLAFQGGFWFAQAGLPSAAGQNPTQARSTVAEEPGLNWRQGQPRHWRYLMLHH
jgi:hypothetical protein